MRAVAARIPRLLMTCDRWRKAAILYWVVTKYLNVYFTPRALRPPTASFSGWRVGLGCMSSRGWRHQASSAESLGLPAGAPDSFEALGGRPWGSLELKTCSLPVQGMQKTLPTCRLNTALLTDVTSRLAVIPWGFWHVQWRLILVATLAFSIYAYIHAGCCGAHTKVIDDVWPMTCDRWRKAAILYWVVTKYLNVYFTPIRNWWLAIDDL